jgi:hypothetical protein
MTSDEKIEVLVILSGAPQARSRRANEALIRSALRRA